jgi:hypothetical protein
MGTALEDLENLNQQAASQTTVSFSGDKKQGVNLIGMIMTPIGMLGLFLAGMVMTETDCCSKAKAKIMSFVKRE